MIARPLAALLLIALSTPAMADPPAAAAAPCGAPQRLTSLDMTMEPGGNFAIPVHVDGHPYRFTIDTGDVYTLISSSIAQNLDFPLSNLRARFELMGGVSSSQAGRSESFDVGTLEAPKFAFLIMPDSALGSFGSDGLLGPDIMSTYDVDIDFAHAKFNIYSPDHCPGGVVYWTKGDYQKIPIDLDDSWHITTPAVLDGQQLTGIIDTGAAHTVLTVSAAKSVFGITLSSPGVKNLGAFSINGTASQTLYTYPFHTLSIGGVTIQDPQVIIAPDFELGGGAKILLGLTTLRQFHMYIAYKEHALYLTPAEAQ